MNFTAIFKLEDQFYVVWDKVYNADSRRSETIILDDEGQNLYTVFNNGQSGVYNDMIVKIRDRDGTCVHSHMIRKYENTHISLLHYHNDDKISFLLSQVYQQASF